MTGLTLDKAIKILERRQDNTPQIGYEWIREANQLGIEAMKAYAQARRLGLPLRCELLPGETKE